MAFTLRGTTSLRALCGTFTHTLDAQLRARPSFVSLFFFSFPIFVVCFSEKHSSASITLASELPHFTKHEQTSRSILAWQKMVATSAPCKFFTSPSAVPYPMLELFAMRPVLLPLHRFYLICSSPSLLYTFSSSDTIHDDGEANAFQARLECPRPLSRCSRCCDRVFVEAGYHEHCREGKDTRGMGLLFVWPLVGFHSHRTDQPGIIPALSHNTCGFQIPLRLFESMGFPPCTSPFSDTVPGNLLSEHSPAFATTWHPLRPPKELPFSLASA